jgi:probable selenium-dependent hydroxylase accessory protein YqeC
VVIGVIGLDALDRSIDEETVHRSQLFCNLTGKKTGEIIDHSSIVALIGAAHGLFKNAPDGAQKIVLLNKADTEALMLQGQQIAREIAGQTPARSCIVASMQQQKFYRLPQDGSGNGT